MNKVYSYKGNNILCDFEANGYRLPTEAEWEFAARGGKRSKGFNYSGSNQLDEVAWIDANSGKQPRDVGTKKPNELGIYDMSGNVWEWCWDIVAGYTYSYDSGQRIFGFERALRGGSWANDEGGSYVYLRNEYPRGHKSEYIGFRLARTK